jgi:hypothetical protein
LLDPKYSLPKLLQIGSEWSDPDNRKHKYLQFLSEPNSSEKINEDIIRRADTVRHEKGSYRLKTLSKASADEELQLRDAPDVLAINDESSEEVGFQTQKMDWASPDAMMQLKIRFAALSEVGAPSGTG